MDEHLAAAAYQPETRTVTGTDYPEHYLDVEATPDVEARLVAAVDAATAT